MPRELITVQVGQCGLQVGTNFWELALQEHHAYNHSGLFDESMSSFFRHVDTRYNPPLQIPLLDQRGQLQPLAALKARAVLVDMEEGVLDEMINRGNLRDLFDERQTVHSVSGSGNNWAHGHCHYGAQYGPSIMEAVRRQAEQCDSLQAFVLLHSLGGGTGSGLGTYILGQLEDHHPDIYRFDCGIFPSDQDDVVTSPYNSVLALGELIAHADAVMPVHNQALMDMVERVHRKKPGSDAGGAGAGGDKGGSLIASPASGKRQRARAFDDMNRIAAQLLTSLTCSMRFEGALNTDLNEITMNLVPFPRMHFLLSSLAPIVAQSKGPEGMRFGPSSSGGTGAGGTAPAASSDPRMKPSSSSSSSGTAGVGYGASKGIDAMFTSLFHPESQLVQTRPRDQLGQSDTSSVYLALGLFGRGPDLTITDMNRNIARLRRTLRMVHWNDDGFKIGLCSTPLVGLKSSVLCLANSTAVGGLMSHMRDRCMRLYSRRAHFHHYLEYMEQDTMDRALQRLEDVLADYNKAERAGGAGGGGEGRMAATQRMQPLG